MNMRPLGRSGLQVAPIALGGNVFGWTTDEANSFAVLDAFVDAGFNLIDTADIYSRWVPGHQGGESERVIGGWLKKSGKYRSEADLGKSPRGAGVKGYLNPRGFAILEALDVVAAEQRATPAAVALAWQIARNGITAPIASATSVAQWEQLARAARLVLTPAQIGQLDHASAGG
jgi:aryl-alcohol dehydrogenase-like predicted oxidoreductase